MSIIDFRVRPPYGNYLNFFKEGAGIEKFHHAFQFPISESAKQKSVDLLIKELDEAGIVKAVVPGRGFIGVTTEELFELSDKYPGRFIIFPYVNPLEGEKALAEVDKWVINGQGKGVAIEPGLGGPEYDAGFDDERIFPLYEKLEKNHIPIMITFSGLVGQYLDNTMPRRIDIVADHFPKLKIILAHGGWPWSKELVTVGFKRPNVFLAPDFYSTNCVGADDYREAANNMLRDQFLYASSYPLAPIKESVQNIKNWKLNPDSEHKVLYANAAKLLGIE
jgi:hypothetical protein